MQFVANGPDIPESLLRAHEEGRVVFFCGAGISRVAGLPDFKGLVDETYRRLNTQLLPLEQDVYARDQYDATLELLERRYPGQRRAVRTSLAQILQPNTRGKAALNTHIALLQLARRRDGALRLVTTNFDRMFELAAKRMKKPFSAYAAPLLPIPKSIRWNGLVYLHGVLSKEAVLDGLDCLVLSSGDFGRAYLTEAWAARFVTELFRNYVVCFVGYSINDTVLRYMMNALAADRTLGEVAPQAYAFGDCQPGNERAKTIEWEAKGIAPILYEVPTGTRDHSSLHASLKVWAETYRDGVLGRERVVGEYALAAPTASTRQDDFVGRMLWAISHESGLPAKRFAEFNPVPSLDWLESFTDLRYRHGDLIGFGVPPHSAVDEKLTFSLIRRPAPYQRAPWMMLTSGGAAVSAWDAVQFQIAHWLVRHLDDPALVIWIAQQGGQLHERMIWLIEHQLAEIARLERSGDMSELDKIRANAPNAIPGPLMRTLWRLLLSGRVRAPWRDMDLYRWKDRVKRDGLTPSLRFELRELLAPTLKLTKPYYWRVGEEGETAPTRIKQLVDVEVVLAADFARALLVEESGAGWRDFLPFLLDDLQRLLHDALDLLGEVGEADERHDRSYWDLPSIIPHRQNRGFREWTVLIELLRDSWLAKRTLEPKTATDIARAWFALPYATFKRLALFAASHEASVPPRVWADWLLGDDARWLWSIETRRETMRLLVLQAQRLPSEQRSALEAAILMGPPRSMFVDGIDAVEWKSLVDRSIWSHLIKLRQGTNELGAAASKALLSLSTVHPNWIASKDDRDEFSHWSSGTGDPDFEESRDIEHPPRRRDALAAWLKESPPKNRPMYEDTWREFCRSDVCRAIIGLRDLSHEGDWPTQRWDEAMSAWGEESIVSRTWQFVAPLLKDMPDEVFSSIAHSLTWWMEYASRSIAHHVDIFLQLSHRVLAQANTQGVDIDQAVTQAINHPVGHVTQGLINVWFNSAPNDNELLPADIKPLFTQLCNTDVDQYRHGRVLLASQLIALFRVDRSWTESTLLPLFDWTRSTVEAVAVWQGFLLSPRLYQPLLFALKAPFLATACHYNSLGENRRQFAAFLTHAALLPAEGYSVDDLRSAIHALPQEGLDEVAAALARALGSSEEQREEYWTHRVRPFLFEIWPKSRELASDRIVESLARLSIAAGREFPEALTATVDWLHAVENPGRIVHPLFESGLIARYPGDALRLLGSVIADDSWPPSELRQCLNAIVAAAPEMIDDQEFKRLSDYSRRHGM
jgi:SIR2-like domain